MGITVAVTGPTGEIGTSVVAALERETEVDRILGMARRPFDPSSRGWGKTRYRRGDIRDRSAVEDLVADADAVVHLAFLILGSRRQTHDVNLAGARNVFEATVAAPRPMRLVYTSSVAAYGFHRDNPVPLTEEVPARGSDRYYYSRQKADIERMLAAVTADTDLEVYVLRPCIVGGPEATALADFMPWNRLGGRVALGVRGVGSVAPMLRPLFPDPGVRLQLVHHDDVAAAIVAATMGRGTPGAFNLAGHGTISVSDVMAAIGGRGVRVPQRLATAAADVVGRLPGLPALADWLQVGRVSMVVDTSKAERELGWRPAYTSAQTLAALAAALSLNPPT